MIVLKSDSEYENGPLSPLSERPARVYLSRLAPGSRPTQAKALCAIAEVLVGERVNPDELPWGQLRYQHTQAVRSALAEKYAPATANRHLAALRGVLEEAFRLGQMSAEDYQRARDIKSVRGSRLPAGRALSRSELRALFTVCARDDNEAIGVRDAAILALAYGAGLRRAEVCAVKMSDVDIDEGSIRLVGKGAKERKAYVTNGGLSALLAWMDVRGDSDGYLFVRINKGGVIDVEHGLSGPAVRAMAKKRARQAKMAGFSPHDLRRTFISDLLDAGADIATVQGMAGHANVQTTARYDRRGDQSKKKAAELLLVPYLGPKAKR